MTAYSVLCILNGLASIPPLVYCGVDWFGILLAVGGWFVAAIPDKVPDA